MQRNFSSQVTLREHHLRRYLFQLPPREGNGFGKVFQTLEDSKGVLLITDYSLMQPKLEQVFLRFARQQEETE